MSDDNRAYVWVRPADDNDSSSGFRFVLTNSIGDELFVRSVQEPDVSEFVMQSVLANPRYLQLDWQERRDFANVEARNTLATIQGQHQQPPIRTFYDLASSSQIPQAPQEQFGSGRSPVPLLGPLLDTPANTEPATAQQKAENGTTPAMTSAPGDAADGEMVVDGAPASGGSNADDDLAPFVAGARARLTEEQWVPLMRVISERFLEDHDGCQLSGEPHRSKMDLMRDALLDPRIVNSNTDYSISRRQFDGQLYERKLVGWSPEVIEHTREALRTNNFTKPEDRKNRRRKAPKTVTPSNNPHDLGNSSSPPPPPPPPPAPTAV